MDDVEWQVWCNVGQTENLLNGVGLKSWWTRLKERGVRVQGTNRGGRWLRSLHVVADGRGYWRYHLGVEEDGGLLISKGLENLLDIRC